MTKKMGHEALLCNELVIMSVFWCIIVGASALHCNHVFDNNCLFIRDYQTQPNCVDAADSINTRVKECSLDGCL